MKLRNPYAQALRTTYRNRVIEDKRKKEQQTWTTTNDSLLQADMPDGWMTRDDERAGTKQLNDIQTSLNSDS
jgi:hypothetical protein